MVYIKNPIPINISFKILTQPPPPNPNPQPPQKKTSETNGFVNQYSCQTEVDCNIQNILYTQSWKVTSI